MQRTLSKLQRILSFAPIILAAIGLILYFGMNWRATGDSQIILSEEHWIIEDNIQMFNLNTDDFKVAQQLYNIIYNTGSKLGLNYFGYYDELVTLLVYEIMINTIMLFIKFFMLPFSWFNSVIDKEYKK